MAIDTERKRKSVVSVARFWHPPVVVPDGSFSVGDRAQIAHTYRGIAEPSEGGGLYKQCHHRAGKHPLATQADVPQLYMRIG